MTVKIITAKRVTCTLCGARLEYEPDDVKSGTAHGRDYYNGVAMVDCPNGHTTPAHNRALTFDTRSPVTACHQTLTGEDLPDGPSVMNWPVSVVPDEIIPDDTQRIIDSGGAHTLKDILLGQPDPFDDG